MTKIVRSLSLLLCALLLAPQAFAQFNGGGNRARTGNRGGGGGGGGVGSSSRDYYSNGTVGEALVTSDPETRRLIVITDEETSKYVGQVITNLDQPKPQVLINVVFLEVTYNNNFDFGIESSFGRREGNTRFGGTNLFSAIAPSTANGMSGLAQEGAANAYGVPGAGIYQVAGDDFMVTLRAIKENGKMEVLSRPTILARNNQEAYILVGQQVPLISNVRFDTVGNQINTVSYQDVGIILRVTPFITSDNYVEMIVSPEISSLDRSQSIPISTGVVAPVINKRSADTVVVTPDGQSVVIGGLMENNKTETDSKIPFLGDIPGLGNLFKRKSKTGTKTELVIFLTPKIIRSPMQLTAASQIELDKAKAVPNAFTEEELNRFLDGVEFKRTKPEKKDK
ncbi:MAG: type II secretion system protein GspD [Verrucomicrobiota bacterium]